MNSDKIDLSTSILRRKVLLGGSVLTASALLPRATLAAANPRSMKKIGDIAMMSVEFDNNGIKTAGNRFVRRALATAANTLRSSSFTVAAA